MTAAKPSFLSGANASSPVAPPQATTASTRVVFVAPGSGYLAGACVWASVTASETMRRVM
jgi:hypothetical protein